MERTEILTNLANEAVSLIKEFREEAYVLGGNPLYNIEVNDSNDIVIFEDKTKEPIEYSLSEISYIFEDEIEGFNNYHGKLNDGIELAIRDAKLEYTKLSKNDFSNYIGKLIYANFRCDEIYNRLLEIEKETRKL